MKRVAASAATNGSDVKKQKISTVASTFFPSKSKPTSSFSTAAIAKPVIIHSSNEPMSIESLSATASSAIAPPALLTLALDEEKQPSLPVAIPFITKDEQQQFNITAQARDWLKSLKNKHIRTVVIAGLYRTGKSALLNWFLSRGALHATAKESVFAVGDTNRACTFGVMACTVPVELPDGSLLLYFDTEGLGALDATATYDAQLFCIAMLLSSLLIYNSMGAIDKRSIGELALAASICKNVRLKTVSGVAEAATGDLFPDFLWVARDSHVDILNKHGQPCSLDDWLNEAWENDDLATVLPTRRCRRLVRPVDSDALIKQVDQQPLGKLRPEFVAGVTELVTLVESTTRKKTLSSIAMTGESLLVFMDENLAAINRGAAPEILSALTLLTEVHCRQAYDEALCVYNTSLSKWLDNKRSKSIALLFRPEDLERLSETIWTPAVIDIYSQSAFGSMVDLYKQKLNDAVSQILTRNVNECLQEIERRVIRMADKFTLAITNKSISTTAALCDEYQTAYTQFSDQVGKAVRVTTIWHSIFTAELTLGWSSQLTVAQQVALEAKQAELDDARTSIRTAVRELEEVHKLHKEASATNAATVEDTRVECKQEIARMQRETQKALAEMRATIDEQSAATAKLEVDWQAQLEQSQTILGQQAAISKEQLSMAVQREVGLQAQLDDTSAKLSQSTQTVAALEHTVNDYRTKLAATNERQAKDVSHEAAMQKLQRELVDQRQHHETLKQDYDSQMEAIGQKAKAKIQELQSNLESVEKAKQLAEHTLTSLKADLVTTLQQLTRDQLQLQDVERQKAVIDSQLQQARLDAKSQHEIMVKQMSVFHDRQTDTFSKEMAKHQETTAKITELSLELERVKSERNEARRQITEQAAIVAASPSVKQEKDKALFQYQQELLKVHFLEAQVQELKQTNSDLHERIINLEKACTIAQMRAQSANAVASIQSPPAQTIVKPSSSVGGLSWLNDL